MDTRKKLNEVLDAADIRRQQYDALADGDTPDDAIKELWELYNESGRAEAKLIGESYATAIKEVKEHVHTTEETLMAMMIWEHANSEAAQSTEKGGDAVHEWLVQPEGAYQGRDNALLLAPLACQASRLAYEGGYDESEDWEFVPLMISIFMETSQTPADVNRYDAEGAGKTILGAFLERTEEGKS